MDLPGIEPGSQDCQPCVIPLHYGPINYPFNTPIGLSLTTKLPIPASWLA